jgi:hypothetical protein
MAANEELIKGIQFLYQVSRQANINADAHEQARKAAQDLVNHFEPQTELTATEPPTEEEPQND